MARGRAASASRFAIVRALFNAEITQALLDGALTAFDQAGIARRRLTVVEVPGAFELPAAALWLAQTKRYAAVVALGCVIRGETPHFEFVAGECARGLQQASLETGVPVAFGVLTVNTVEQALQRAATSGDNKGGEAMLSALEMAGLLARL